MAVARGDEGSSNVTNTPTTSTPGSAVRRRIIRKTSPVGAAGETAPIPTPVSSAQAATPPSPLSPAHAAATRLDDLYRLPMPKLFAFAEKEGIFDHTGMNRGQLIMGVVR